MSYHRGGQAGAVALSYSTSPMAPHSPSRRYSSGAGSSGTTTSGIGGTASKLSTYRTTVSSSLLDRPTSFYTSSSGAGLRSNYITTEYRRSYCGSGSYYSSSSTGTSIRRKYSSEYSRSNCSPARSVSSSTYSETGGSSSSGVATTTGDGTSGRYASSTSSASIGSSPSSRERNNIDAAADIISKYSPAGYVPSIQRQQQAGGGAHHWRHRSASSSLSELYGGDEREAERRDPRPESSLSSSSSSSSPAATNLWPRSGKRRPFTGTVLTAVGHARADSAASLAEVTTVIDDSHLVARKLNFDDKNDDETDDSKDVTDGDDRHNNNGNNLGDCVGQIDGGKDVACGYGVNNNDDARDSNDDDEDGNADVDDDDENNDDNLNSRHRRFHQQRSHHRPDEVVLPAMRNLLSPAAAAAAAAGGGGGGSLIGVSSIDLLTNLTTNPRNTELLINNNAQDKMTAEQHEEREAGIPTSNEVIRGSGDELTFGAFAFLPSRRLNDSDIPEDDEEESKLCLSSSSDDGSLGSPPTDTVAGRPSVTHGDDPSLPSTSRRADQSGLFSGAACSSTTGNLTSSPITPPTAHQSFYGAVNEQYMLSNHATAGFNDDSIKKHVPASKSRAQPCKLAHVQLIEWALWCLWTVITLVVACAFFLGTVAPLVSFKRVSPKINSTRVNNSVTLQSVSSRTAQYPVVVQPQEGSPTNRSGRNRQVYHDERCGLNGLRNIGNTCFMNSVIQCLSNTRPLLEYLLNEQYLADINTSTSSMKGALIKAFSQVIHELWEVGGDHVVNTTALKSQIQRFAPRFMGYSQQDAQEFLRYLLEGLHEDVNRVTTKLPPIHGDIPDSYSDMQKAVESWKRYLRSEDSMIVDVFVGQLRSSLHCTSCDHVSVTLDPFWDLSLPIPARSGTVKLSQCLEHFTREEVLDGDEKPTCSKCQMRRKCTKSFSIQKFPKILVIHLKRFSPMERFRGKLNVMVDFPLTGLDLSAFAAPRVPGCTYNLYGVANHSGTTYSGHYTAYCKHPYSGEWHEYNDSRVSVVSPRSVVSSEAYVLFYEQQPHSSHL